MELHAFCDETRPLLQGARLTTYELYHAGIDCTLICDNMASIVMKEGKIDAVFVGCDGSRQTATRPTRSAHRALRYWQNITVFRFMYFARLLQSIFPARRVTILKSSSALRKRSRRSFLLNPQRCRKLSAIIRPLTLRMRRLSTAIITEKGYMPRTV